MSSGSSALETVSAVRYVVVHEERDLFLRAWHEHFR
jgi:hypothetical protein